MKRFRSLEFGIVGMLLSGCIAQAQTVSTVSNNNVTSWSAKLFGSYTDLATNSVFGYELKFYYGETDGGTNALSWDHASSSLYIEPTSTNDNFGTFNRTIVELTETNIYYFRAMAHDFFGTFIWATQTLSFFTAGMSPTSMPNVTHKSVTVLPDGTLHSPLNFFEANGILPTQGVEQIFVRITSNETWIAIMLTGKLDRANALVQGNLKLPTRGDFLSVSEAVEFRSYSIGDDSWQTNYLVWAHEYGGLRGGTNANLPENIYWHNNNDGSTSSLDAGLFHGLGPSFYRNASSITNRDSWGYISGPQASNSFVNKLGHSVISGALSIVNGFLSLSNSTLFTTNIVAPGGDFSRRHVTIKGADTSQPSDTAGGVNIRAGNNSAGPHGSISFFDGAGNLAAHFLDWEIIFNKPVTLTQPVTFHSSAQAFNGQHAGNAAGMTNLPLQGLRLGNSYTGGVMTLRTTDGVTFFLQ